jgi:hypothetical protein
VIWNGIKVHGPSRTQESDWLEIQSNEEESYLRKELWCVFPE